MEFCYTLGKITNADMGVAVRLARIATAFIATAALLLPVSVCLAASAQDNLQNRATRKPYSPSRIEKGLESPQREQWQQPDRVVAALGLQPGDVVADVGAGSGYFSFRLAKTVGSGGKVYAVDIQDEMLAYIRAKMQKTGITNIVPVKSTPIDPMLPPGCCNSILLVNTYHELGDPVALMKNLRKALKPGGTIAIVNWNESVTRKKLYVPMDLLVEQMKLAGFRPSKSHDFLERQYFLVFSQLN